MVNQVSPGVNISEIDLATVVPSVASSTGAIAGLFRWGPVGERTLISNETELVSIFGKPTSLNPETFFTAASFLAYSNSLLSVRAANTTDASNGAYNALANTAALTGGSSNAVYNAVKSSTDYYANKNDTAGVFDSSVLYIAKYPGALGNSLKVSICDSVNAFSSNVNLAASAAQSNSYVNIISPSFTVSVGSNTGVIVFTPDTDVTAATNAAAIVNNSIVIGDLVKVGNTTIGTQQLRVTGLTTTSNSSTASLTMNFADPYRLSTDYVANSTMNSTSLNRSWQYSTVIPNTPINTDYVNEYGSSTNIDGMHVVVIDQDGLFTDSPGTVLERFVNVSRATDAKYATGESNYYKTVINQSSQYIWWANDRSGAVSNTAVNVANSSQTLPVTIDFTMGQDGYSGFTEANASLATIASGYDLFNSTETSDVSLILQGKPISGTTTVDGMSVSNFQLANYLIQNIAEIRKDCLVFITPDDTIVKNNPRNEATALVNWCGALADSSYAVRDSGYKYTYDRYNDVYRYVPMNGDIAGLCARTDQTNDSWWSPAGFNRGQIKNIVKLRYNPNKTERDALYKSAINPVVTFPGQGTILYGDKTGSSKPSAFSHINVRRLFITLEKAISQVAKYSLFEFNDEFTRAQFRNLINPYLRDVQARRGINDFLVVCDTTNNTAARIDRNEFWGDIYIKPTRSINFIQLNFVAVGTGVQFSTVVGQF